MANIAVAGTMPAGSDAPVDSLENGEIEITIVKVKENNELEVEYPNGFIRDHQAATIEVLVPKLVNNLRARYGVKSVSTKVAPPISEGAKIIMEISNDG